MTIKHEISKLLPNLPAYFFLRFWLESIWNGNVAIFFMPLTTRLGAKRAKEKIKRLSTPSFKAKNKKFNQQEQRANQIEAVFHHSSVKPQPATLVPRRVGCRLF